MGRRSLGKRELLGTRVSPALAQHYRDLAKKRGRSQSEFIAELLLVAEQHLDELPASQEELPLSPDQEEELPLSPDQEEELPLSQAS